jgi:hypothetical protein
MRPGLRLEPLLQAISDFLENQKDMIEQVRCDLTRGLKKAETGRNGLTPGDLWWRRFALLNIQQLAAREGREGAKEMRSRASGEISVGGAEGSKITEIGQELPGYDHDDKQIPPPSLGLQPKSTDFRYSRILLQKSVETSGEAWFCCIDANLGEVDPWWAVWRVTKVNCSTSFISATQFPKII